MRTCETQSVPGDDSQVSLPNQRRMAEDRLGVRFTHSTPERGKATYMGKGWTKLRSLQRKLLPGVKDWTHEANLPAGDSKQSGTR
jgi:hypothetical protein